MKLVIDLQGAQSESRQRGIGRYCRNLALAMAATCGEHELHILLNGGFGDATDELRALFAGRLPAGRITVWHGPGRQASNLADSAARRLSAERLRSAALAALQPDLVLVGSLFEGFGDDAVTLMPPNEVMLPTVAVCYDLIPLLNPSFHFDSPLAESWYHRRLLQMRHMQGLLAISASSRQEAIAVGYPADRVINILAGVEPQFQPATADPADTEALLARYGLPPDFILCVGTVEPRKNLDGLIRAFALLPPGLRQRHPLVATGWNDSGRLAPLRRLAQECGIAANEIVLLDKFVHEADLPSLYRASALAVSPSLHEGFGLAAVEGMASGVPVLGSNTTSLPDVIGNPEALFDPTAPADIAARMQAVLTDPALRHRLVAHGLEHVRTFTWPLTADRAWRGLEAILAKSQAPTMSVARRKLRLAVLTPLCAAQPRLLALLNALTAQYMVEIISLDPSPADPLLRVNFPVHPPARLATGGFARVLYMPDDDGSHTVLMLRLLGSYPGMVVLPSHPLAQTLHHMVGGAGDDALHTLLLDLYGWRALIDVAADPLDGARRYPCEAVFDRRAIGTLPAGALPEEYGALIERCYALSPLARFDACLADLAADEMTAPDRAAVAVAATLTFGTMRAPSLFLDVSMMVRHDAGTGVQRVVREIVRRLGAADIGAYRLEPVSALGAQLRLEHGFAARLFGLAAPPALSQPATVSPGDVYVMLDLNLHDLDGLVQTLRHVRQRGGRPLVVVYDLLPYQMPACFPETVQVAFPRWLTLISTHAEGLLCISRTVADDLRAWLDQAQPPRLSPLSVATFPLGSDFLPLDAPERAAAAAQHGGQRPSFLMVGTVEPRKGHAFVLDAFERVWAAGCDVQLVIAGKAGWMMDHVFARMRAHPEFGHRLVWLENVSDLVIAGLYRSSSALIMASEGEGFGLPIVEAARAGLPVICRDIAVYREIAGAAACYFPGTDPAILADIIPAWVEKRAAGRAPDPSAMKIFTWAEASQIFARAALEGEVYYRWSSPGAMRPG